MEADGDDGSNVDDSHICDTEDDGDKDKKIIKDESSTVGTMNNEHEQ